MVCGHPDKSGAFPKVCVGMQAHIYSAAWNKRTLINGSYGDDGFGNRAGEYPVILHLVRSITLASQNIQEDM